MWLHLHTRTTPSFSLKGDLNFKFSYVILYDKLNHQDCIENMMGLSAKGINYNISFTKVILNIDIITFDESNHHFASY